MAIAALRATQEAELKRGALEPALLGVPLPGEHIGAETFDGKRKVALKGLEPAGSYAVKLEFDDGHDSGLYDWDLLYALGQNQQVLWQEYLDKLLAAGASRDPK
jgi:DUF971 family protein